MRCREATGEEVLAPREGSQGPASATTWAGVLMTGDSMLSYNMQGYTPRNRRAKVDYNQKFLPNLQATLMESQPGVKVKFNQGQAGSPAQAGQVKLNNNVRWDPNNVRMEGGQGLNRHKGRNSRSQVGMMR